jgi:phage baseplate assembly protein W
MTQIDMFEELKPKIYESPDGGQTVYARDFGSTERTLVKTAVQQQWKINFKGEEVAVPQNLASLV